MPDQEAGVDPEAALERVEVLGEAGPVPGDAVLERGQGHALDLGHHAADVVGVLGVDRGQREPAVAADHGGHAVHVGGRGGGVPEELGVVVGVRVDDAGHTIRPVASNSVVAGSSTWPTATMRPSRIPMSAGAAGAPGAVDERAGSDDVVEHGTSGGVPARRARAAKSDGPSA